jgi:hypothetical protein
MRMALDDLSDVEYDAAAIRQHTAGKPPVRSADSVYLEPGLIDYAHQNSAAWELLREQDPAVAERQWAVLDKDFGPIIVRDPR